MSSLPQPDGLRKYTEGRDRGLVLLELQLTVSEKGRGGMTTCPTCGNQVDTGEGVKRIKLQPFSAAAKSETVTMGAETSINGTCDCVPNKQWIIDAQDKEIEGLEAHVQEIADILSCREGESVVEAAKRWRETMTFYGDRSNYVPQEAIASDGVKFEMRPVLQDGGQRARELLGDVE